MDITEIIIKKLDFDLTPAEDVFFTNWIEASEINRDTFIRLQNLNKETANLREILDVKVQMAWRRVKQNLDKPEIL